MTTKTHEELRSALVDALEGLDDAERDGIVLSREAIAALRAKVTEANNAVLNREATEAACAKVTKAIDASR
jgi:hypothetical protein